MKQLNKYKSILVDFIFYLSILLFIIGFNFSDNMTGGWYQQFMPNLNGRLIRDITFLDSLNGYAITNRLSSTDTSFILRTTNSGDNWTKVYRETTNSILNRIQFINQTTGFVGGYIYANSTFHFIKTTNSGLNWFYIDAPFDVAVSDMYFLNLDTIWLVDNGSLTGGVFRTTNGGLSWDRQFSAGNPDHIYMVNELTGFISNFNNNSGFYRTSNGGQNWTLISSNESFKYMHFNDSLLGWKTSPMKITTDGGLNWTEQTLPNLGNNSTAYTAQFSNINKDTIWLGGGTILYPGQGTRAYLFRTTNKGNTWYIQMPDTSFQIPVLYFIDFVDRMKGWSYIGLPRGIHTITGGDTTFLTEIKKINTTIPKEFILYQNYPNPFNPNTKIKYQISNIKYKIKNVKLVVFNIAGKEITILVNKKQGEGQYEVPFNGDGFSSGVYFYSLYADGILIDTKKMILIK